MRYAVFLAFAAVALSLGGCSKGPKPTGHDSAAPEAPLRPKIVGKWTTSTALAVAGSATTITFLESGEYQASGVLTVQGQPLMMEKDGRKVPVPSTVSGV